MSAHAGEERAEFRIPEQINESVSTIENDPRTNLTQVAFLRTLFRGLDEYHIRYCVLHGWEGLPHELASDLDLAVHPRDIKRLKFVFSVLHREGYRPVQALHYAIRAYRFDFAWHEGSAIRFVGVDVAYDWVFGGAACDGRLRQADYWIPEPGKEFAYLLVKKTWKGKLPTRQSERLTELVMELGGAQAEQIAGRVFGSHHRKSVVEACKAGTLGGLLRKLRPPLWRSTFRNPFNSLYFAVANPGRLAERWMRPTGVAIALLGPDGIGKSTLIEQLSKTFTPLFAQYRLYHFRPEFLVPLDEAAAPITDPYAKPLRGSFQSAIRLFGLLLDFWFGQLFRIRPLLARSTLIMFDRHFQDVTADPLRYRYGGPAWLPRLLAHFIKRPDMIFLLDADECTIFSRKQEVDIEQLQHLRRAYAQLACRCSTVRIDASRGVAEIAQEASGLLICHLTSRFKRRYSRWLAY